MNSLARMWFPSILLSVAASIVLAQDEIKIGTQIRLQILAQEPDQRWSLPTQAAAVNYARSILGGGGDIVLREPAKLAILLNEETPFLKEKIVGRPVWHLEVSDIGWKSTNPYARGKALSQTFDVFVDAEKGHLIRILSRWPEEMGNPPRLPNAEIAADSMRNSGRERFHGFPESAPRVTFQQALTIVAKDGIKDPGNANQIDAQYVLQSEMDREPRSVWSIMVRGIPPLRSHLEGVVPRTARDHIRNIVDAQSGKWLGATVSPQAGPPEPKNGGAENEKSEP